MKSFASLARRTTAAPVLLLWCGIAAASSTNPSPFAEHLSAEDAPPPLSAIIAIADTSTADVVGPVPFTPAAHDGVVRSQLRPKTGSYEVPNLDRDASVTFRFRAPAVVGSVGIASSFEVTKRVHIDLLVGERWVRARDALKLKFAVGVPVLVPLDHPEPASAVRLTSLDRHLFLDEFTAYSAAR